jgi:hypothetical protein
VREFADLKPDQAADEIKRREKLAATRKPAAVSVPTAPLAGASNGQAATPVPVSVSGGIIQNQIDDLNRLTQDMAEYGLTREQFQAALAKRGASRIAELTETTAAGLISKMRSQLTLKLLEAHAASGDEEYEGEVPAAAGVEKSGGADAQPSP